MMEMKAILKQAALYLRYHGILNSFREAELLMMDFLGVTSCSVFSKICLNEEQVALFWERVKIRGRRVPTAYIQGVVPFLNLFLHVDHNVLIPRQETELLADRIIQYLRSHPHIRTFYDVCCGSGCLGLSVKKACPHLEVVLSDICPKAIHIAKKNAAKNHVSVECLIGDLFTPFQKPAEAFVCNPPYLSFSEIFQTDPEVRCHEPWKALVAGRTGCEFYEKIINDIDKILVRGGVGWLEIGCTQGIAIKKMFEYSGLPYVLYQDYAGLDRFFFLENEPYDTVS